MRALIHLTAWERVSWWRRLLCAFGRVAALVALLIVLSGVLGPPISIFFTARWEARKVPAVKVTPQSLSDYSISDAPGIALSYFGYSFEVPWDTTYKTKAPQKNSTKTGIVQFKFESGQDLLLIVPANQGGLLSELVQDPSSHLEDLRPLFGDLINRFSLRSIRCTVEYHAFHYSSVRTARGGGAWHDAVDDQGYRRSWESRNRHILV